jgi:hypothetical protein
MATIYRFVIEQKQAKGNSGRAQRDPTQSKSGAAKKGRYVSIFGGEKGGVEHNRKLRAINPLINKMTHGVWEKGMRLGRAGMGLITRNTETGAIGISGTAVAIIVSFAVLMLLKWQNYERQKADKLNAQNYKQLENGTAAIRSAYDISVNLWNGRYTYNQNK